jgi:hypothetical protein
MGLALAVVCGRLVRSRKWVGAQKLKLELISRSLLFGTSRKSRWSRENPPPSSSTWPLFRSYDQATNRFDVAYERTRKGRSQEWVVCWMFQGIQQEEDRDRRNGLDYPVVQWQSHVFVCHLVVSDPYSNWSQADVSLRIAGMAETMAFNYNSKLSRSHVKTIADDSSGNCEHICRRHRATLTW